MKFYLGFYLMFIYILRDSNGSTVIATFNFDLINNYINNKLDNDLPTPNMIVNDGYPVESHTVTTEDGYLLTLHRIPGDSQSHPVFLQHGLLGSSADWVIPGPQKSLPYLLYDKGYDIWIGNARGNTYSRAHTNYSIDDFHFWDFSFHEMGVHDLPAVIYYITDLTRKTLVYVGHSMGTTMGYIMASERPDVAKKVRFMLSLAPVAFMGHLKSPLRRVAPFVSDIEFVTHFFGINEFLPQNKFTKYLAKHGCELNTIEEDICENILFAICGFDASQFNKTLLPLILGHTPAGASIKTIIHYAQEIISNKFQYYDYGLYKNMELYNTTYPPNYNLTKINIPIALLYSNNDWLVSLQDVEILSKKLHSIIDTFEVSDPNFNHVDFLWSINVRKLVYDHAIALIDRFHD